MSKKYRAKKDRFKYHLKHIDKPRFEFRNKGKLVEE